MQNIQISLDCKTVSLLLKSENPKPPRSMMQIWRRVKALLQMFSSVNYSHCFRVANRAADFLVSKHPDQKFVLGLFPCFCFLFWFGGFGQLIVSRQKKEKRMELLMILE